MIVGGYLLDVYCDADGCNAHAQETGHTGAWCRTMLRRLGWRISTSKNRAYCPEHPSKTKP
ncbi:MAG: hypothetical protein KAS32_05000 [Candidatus Peribacteraceae bacterium]|nr:hypothetical protein [Candidatus Peribacteraceae bacterium]